MLERWKEVVEKRANNDDCLFALNSSLTRLFDVPTMNLEVNAYNELANFDSYQQKPPATASLANTEIEECLKKSLLLHYLYAVVGFKFFISRFCHTSIFFHPVLFQPMVQV